MIVIKMTTEVKIIADSISPTGVRITTMQLKYPRFIHSELMTHRVLSRNASSSRAIPVNRMLKYVWNDPAIPIYWGSNKPGMQAGTELPTFRRLLAIGLWKLSGKAICIPVWCMSKLGLHKQVSNRLLEPWLHIHVVVTSTEWDNFFNLRCHKDAQPEIQQLAFKMRSMLTLSRPRHIDYGEWHLPYVNCLDRRNYSVEDTIKMSAARCCRVSYVNHEGKHTSLKEDIDRYNSLVEADPPHMSPVEHQATPAVNGGFFFNLKGWKSQRWVLESQKVKE